MIRALLDPAGWATTPVPAWEVAVCMLCVVGAVFGGLAW